MSQNLTRRSLLGTSLLAGASALLTTSPTPAPKRQLRIAHLTDTHITTESKAQLGFQKALEAAQSLDPKPDYILFGGDEIMDAFAADESKTKAQWDSYNSVKKANLEIPAIHTIGNHDIWGWNKSSSQTTGQEAKWGKNWCMEQFQISKPYHTVTKNNWKIIVLDSTFPSGGGYTAKLDEPQFEWLENELKSTPKETNILLSSHIPLLCVCGFVDGDNAKTGNWVVPGSWMHIDFLRLKNLFHNHPNVKAAVSGHMHQVDMANFLGVDYYCNGAVSGAWWGGNYYEFGPGFAVIDLFDDGSVTNIYQSY